MEYTTSNNGGRTDFWPDNTPDTLYIAGSVGPARIDALLYAGQEWFGCKNPSTELNIEIENIHTDAIYHDSYVASDYTMFYILTQRDIGGGEDGN